MDETELEKRLKNLEVPPPRKEAKDRTRQEAWFRLRKSGARDVLSVRNWSRGIAAMLVLGVSFVMLSYTVSQSTRSGGGDAGKETSRISSAQLTQYPAGVRTSLVRMIISGQAAEHLEFNAPSQFAGCTEEPPGSGQYPRCVFHPTGGGATWVEPSADLLVRPSLWRFNAENRIYKIGTTGANAPDMQGADLVAFLPLVTRTICQSINAELGIEGVPVEIGIVFSAEADMINRDGHSPTDIGAGGGTIGGDGAEALTGQPFGCFRQDNVHVYYHVLIER